LRCIFVDIQYTDARSVARKFLCDRASDTAGSPCHDGNFAVEAKGI
jgi:hypothetical protein